MTSIISLMIRFARQREDTLAGARPHGRPITGGSIRGIAEHDATWERQFSRPQWHTSSFVVVTMPSVHVSCVGSQVRKGKRARKTREEMRKKREERETERSNSYERRNLVNEAEGREAEKRNDDETRSHYYIHIQARWGEPSPSFRVLRPPVSLSVSLSLFRKPRVLFLYGLLSLA